MGSGPCAAASGASMPKLRLSMSAMRCLAEMRKAWGSEEAAEGP